MILPNSHSTVTLTELTSALYASIIGVKMPLRYGDMQGPQTHTWAPLWEKMHFAQAHGGGWSPPAY